MADNIKKTVEKYYANMHKDECDLDLSKPEDIGTALEQLGMHLGALGFEEAHIILSISAALISQTVDRQKMFINHMMEFINAQLQEIGIDDGDIEMFKLELFKIIKGEGAVQ